MKNKIIFFIFFLIQVTSLSLYAATVSTSIVTLDTTANSTPVIATSSDGKYVHAAWEHFHTDVSYLSSSADFGATWTSNIDTAKNGSNQQIATSSDGKYVYATADGGEVGASGFWVYVSSNFGVSFSYTQLFATASHVTNIVSISTSSDGQYVYAATRNATTGNLEIYVNDNFGNPADWTLEHSPSLSTLDDLQVTTSSTGEDSVLIYHEVGTDPSVALYSSDFGDNWSTATISSGTLGDQPQITSSSSGTYVYAITGNDPGVSTSITLHYSSDSGVNYTASSSITGKTGSDPQVTTDSSGKYVYVIWQEATTNNIKVYFSSDFGNTFTDTGFNFGTSTNAVADITTDSTGQYVYAVFNDDSPNTVKFFFSDNFGATWQDTDPNNTLYGIGSDPKVATNSTGEKTYVIFDNNPDVKVILATTTAGPKFPLRRMTIYR